MKINSRILGILTRKVHFFVFSEVNEMSKNNLQISQNRAECYEVSFIYHTEIWQTLLSQSNAVWAGVKFVCLNEETNDSLKMEEYKCAAAVLT